MRPRSSLRRARHQDLGALAEVLVEVGVVLDHLGNADGGELEEPPAGTRVPEPRAASSVQATLTATDAPA